MTDRAVLLSIKPKYCELIASGKKTVEVRKTKPKIPTPFKCYIYCTKDFYRKGDGYIQGKCCGKVIGEFVCDNIIKFSADKKADNIKLSNMAILSCLNCSDIEKYAGDKYYIYGFHISDLVIYNKPKELSEFRTVCNYRNDDGSCQYDKVECDCCNFDFNPDYSVNLAECLNYMHRPPQSWCYVQEVK